MESITVVFDVDQVLDHAVRMKTREEAERFLEKHGEELQIFLYEQGNDWVEAREKAA